MTHADPLDPKPKSIGRDASLEGLRGLAALAVVAWHIILVFLPAKLALDDSSRPIGEWAGSPLLGLVHGRAAVCFFFVLSGYVLSRQYFLQGDPGFIGRNAIKRWPRLAMPVLITCVGSWAIFAAGFYSYAEAGSITGSVIFQSFFQQMPFQPTLMDAVTQGLFTSFLFGHQQYVPVLWTMQYEFFGSMIVFALALGMRRLPSRVVQLCVLLAAMIAVRALGYAWYVPFLVGLGLAAFLPRMTPRPVWLGIVGSVTALYLAGYSQSNVGAYELFFIAGRGPNAIYIWSVASVLLLCSIWACPGLSRWLDHRTSVYLGWLSFPIYLVHLPVMLSVGASVLILLTPHVDEGLACAGAIIATLAGSTAAAIALGKLNDRWLVVLNNATNRLLESRRLRVVQTLRERSGA